MSDKDDGLMHEEHHWNHTGEEDRRKKQRRTGEDRRDMIRFEPDKEDRRQKTDRRGGKDGWGDKPI